VALPQLAQRRLKHWYFAPPMIETLVLCFGLVAVTVLCAIASRRLGIPHSILLVLTGLILAIVPGLPAVELDPAFVMLLFLPPLLYAAGVSMSWRGFRRDLEPIILLAIGCVLFTTIAVAGVAHYILGWPWAVAFVLGAVVSPPDIIAPMAVARRLLVPRRILTILEGEGLVNDATALILFSFAIAAVSTGTFVIANAVSEFLAIVVGEAIYGIAVGWGLLRLRRWVDDPDVEITLSLLTPYVAFWPPEMMGGSGVLAAVSAGLFVSWNGSRLIAASTRLQGFFIWRLAVYLIEALLFLLTGLQVRTVIESLGKANWGELALQGLAISLLVILIRFVWVYPAAYLPRWLSRTSTPPWQGTFAIAFTGIRGVVSLAAALSIPLTLANGQPFPERNTVLFVTFCVILTTLLGQGLVLPTVFRRLGLVERGRVEEEAEKQREFKARIDSLRGTLKHLDLLIREDNLSPALARALRTRLQERLRRLELDHKSEGADGAVRHGGQIERKLIDMERDQIYRLRQEGALSDEAKRRIERELDLEEARILQKGQDPA
jgi:monovalent cation/hydrogen antiporter